MARPRHVRPAFLVLLLIGLSPRPAGAAERWPVARGPSHEPAPHRYDPAQVRALPKAFLEDAVACVLYAGSTHLIEPDGTIEAITHEITRLNGRKGIDKLGEHRSITYDPSYQKLTLNEARIHKVDGRIVAVEPRHLHLRDVATDYQVYDPEKQLIISFPSLEVGDVIEVKWTLRGKNPEHGGQFFTRYSFGDPGYPVALDELRVRLPRGKVLKFATSGGRLDPVRTEKGDTQLYSWKAVHCRKPPQDEDQPSKEELRVTVSCSTFASWQEVAAWKQRLRADCWKCTEEVRKATHRIIKGRKDPADRARALTYWVRRKVRYISAGEKHDYTPHPPARVLANRYGDCKDTSQLLAVMLREAGIPVSLATLGARDDGQVVEAVPSPWGTHAILLTTIHGKEHWIDTTATRYAWDFLPRDDRDRVCYLVDDRGRFRLARTPVLTADDNRFDQTTEVWISPDGTTRNERTVRAHGSAAVSQRDNFLEVPVGERRRQVATQLQDANSRARLTHLDVDETALRDFDRPVAARLVFTIPAQFSGAPNREGSITDSKVWGKLLSHTFDYDRKVPFVLPSPFVSRHRYVIHLPAAYALESLPRDQAVRSAWGTFRATVKALDGRPGSRDFEVQFDTRLEKARVEPADFAAFRSFHEEVSRHYRVWLTLKPARDLADAPGLEAILAWAPEDAFSCGTLARLYLKNGRMADARRVLARARFYHPNDAALWELTARSAATPREEEAAQRELVRRFPGELNYLLDLGEFLVQHGSQIEARKLLEPLTTKGSAVQRARAHLQLASSCYIEEEDQEALKHLQAAERQDAETTGTAKALLLKGRVFEKLGKLRDAARTYEEALGVNAQSEVALDALVRLALAVHNRPQALQYLRRYTVAVGDDVVGLLLAAEQYLRLEHYDDAFDLASRARELRFHEKAQRILGLVYLHRGDLAHAVKHLDKAEPDAVVLDGLLRAYLGLGNVRELTARLEQAGRLDNPTPALRGTLAQARRLVARRAQLGKECKAPAGREGAWGAALDRIACAEELRATGRPAGIVENMLAPAFAGGLAIGPAFALRGRLQLERGRLGLALADAERAIALAPGLPGGYCVRGRVRLERTRAGALEDLEKAVKLSGRRDAEGLHSYAAALAAAGRKAEAVAALREAMKLKHRHE